MLPAAEPARSTRRVVAKAAVELGFPDERIEVVDSVADAVGTRAARDAAPTVRSSITGSLYFVGAARCVLVDD